MRSPRSKIELYEEIRRDNRAGLSIRAIMRKHRVSWPTVKEAVTSAWPQPPEVRHEPALAIQPYTSIIDEILCSELNSPRNRRHRATQIRARLIEEHSMQNVSYEVVRIYVARRRLELLADAGNLPAVDQRRRPGEGAEADFGEIAVRLRGEMITCTLFTLRMSFSGKTVHRASISGGQEAFFEGHAHAFTILGGVPAGKICYNQLKTSVARVLGFSRTGAEVERWKAFRLHYGLEALYLNNKTDDAPGNRALEGHVGRFRRNHFGSVPNVDSLAGLNSLIDRWDSDDENRRIDSRTMTIDQMVASEAALLKPLPDEPFETGRWLTPRVDRVAQITVRTNRYSVPARLIGQKVGVLLHASHLVVSADHEEVANHERLPGKGGIRVELDHYLESLHCTPGALPGATALEQARAAGKFTPVHDAWWEAALEKYGPRAGTQALIEVLLLHRHMPHDHVVVGLAAALRAGTLTADAVALEARKATETAREKLLSEITDTDESIVHSLTRRRLAKLPTDTRPLPSVEVYDQLLHLLRTPRDEPTAEGTQS